MDAPPRAKPLSLPCIKTMGRTVEAVQAWSMAMGGCRALMECTGGRCAVHGTATTRLGIQPEVFWSGKGERRPERLSILYMLWTATGTSSPTRCVHSVRSIEPTEPSIVSPGGLAKSDPCNSNTPAGPRFVVTITVAITYTPRRGEELVPGEEVMVDPAE